MVISFKRNICDRATLRAALEALGHVFRTHSNTKATLLDWRAWGSSVLDHLDGMSTFALLTRNRSEPLLALPNAVRALIATISKNFLTLGYVPNPQRILSGGALPARAKIALA